MFKLGVQLYQFSKPAIEQHLELILSHISKIGYTSIEGFPGHDQIYSELCSQNGLYFAGPHVVASDLYKLIHEDNKLLEYCQSMQARHVISSGLIEWNERSAKDYSALAALLSASAEFLSKHDIQLHYHNHQFEFELIDVEKTGIEILAETCSEQVHFCFDLGWVARAGENPLVYLDRYASRISYLHLRDFSGSESVALGNGDYDLSELMQAMMQMPNLTQVMVEQDPCAGGVLDAISCAQCSFDYIQQLRVG